MSRAAAELASAIRSREISGRLRSLKFLIIEDQDAARQSLRSCAQAIGGVSIEFAQTHSEALHRIRRPDVGYDIILCDYNLGSGRSGQHLLEECRRFELIGDRVLWIMVTAEKTYEQVVSAVEWAPDDYILKPFTPNMLMGRLDRALTQRDFFEPYLALPRSDPAGRVAALADLLGVGGPRYRIDVMRRLAEENLRMGSDAAAIDWYDRIISEVYPFPWAQAGKARALMGRQEYEQAEALLAQVTREAPNYFEAQDLHAEVLGLMGESARAVGILERASAQTPRNYARKHRLSLAAYANGDPERAAAVMSDVLANDPFARDRPADFLEAARAAIGSGRRGDALAALGEIRGPALNSMAAGERIAMLALQVSCGRADAERDFWRCVETANELQLGANELVDIVRAQLALEAVDDALATARRAIENPGRAKMMFKLLLDVFSGAGLAGEFRALQRDVASRIMSKRLSEVA